jgi:hypothetical protein
LFEDTSQLLLEEKRVNYSIAKVHRRKRFAKVLGKIQTTILLSVIYFLIIPIFSLLRFKDPLKKRLGSQTYWQPFKSRPITMENFERMF